MSKRWLLLAGGPALVVLAAVVTARVVFGIPIAAMTRDAAAIAGLHPLAGFVSNLGIMLWCAAATACLVAAAALHAVVPGEQARFFLSAGLLSLYLMLDDCFQLHELTEHL